MNLAEFCTYLTRQFAEPFQFIYGTCLINILYSWEGKGKVIIMLLSKFMYGIKCAYPTNNALSLNKLPTELRPKFFFKAPTLHTNRHQTCKNVYAMYTRYAFQVSFHCHPTELKISLMCSIQPDQSFKRSDQ